MTTNKFTASTLALAVAATFFSQAGTASTLDSQALKSPYQFKTPPLKNATLATKSAPSAWLIELNAPASFGISLSQRNAAIQSIAKQQASVIQQLQVIAPNVQVINRTSKLANALVVKGDAADVQRMANAADVKAIYPLRDRKLHVADSAEYINAKPLVDAQLASGNGVRVAVLDTGIDYTHAAFGGEGTEAAYNAAVADPTTVDWPQGQVMGGYDFVNGDADPIDFGTSHGTHVSHSVTGIAPDVELYVYSVCAGTCSGAAQLAALEAAMDPDQNGDISDRVDVINMSLGGDYGDLAEDGVSVFINKAVQLGVSVVISAGNDGDNPFIVGGPSTTENALSVGAMEHPTGQVLLTDGTVAGESVTVQSASFGPQESFSFDSSSTTLTYPNANQTACEPFSEDMDFTDQVVLIDRGGCAFTAKVLAAQQNGAAYVIIANNVDDGSPAPMGGFDENVTIPSIGVNFTTGASLKQGSDFSFEVEARDSKGLVAGFSSRGPSISGILKPEITAPGVNIQTAEPGTGTELTGATGTSFSGPMTAGAMSLLKEAMPERNAFERKATIMNAANLEVYTELAIGDEAATLAPISLIGSGLVDVEKASQLPVAAWDSETQQAALSFGLLQVAGKQELTKTITVKNFSSTAQDYDLVWQPRYANDAELEVDFPSTITVPAGQSMSFDVTVSVDASNLPEWGINGLNFADPQASAMLTASELDGALMFMQGSEEALHLVYHILPKAVAEASVAVEQGEAGIQFNVTNTGAIDFDPVFSALSAMDERDDAEQFDLIAGSIETFSNPEGSCDTGLEVVATMVLAEPLTHSFSAGLLVDFDTDQDGAWDYTMQNANLAWFGDLPNQEVSFTYPTGTLSGATRGMFTPMGDNYVLLQTCAEDIGLSSSDLDIKEVAVRFRTSADAFPINPPPTLDEMQGSFAFTQATAVAAVVDEQGDPIAELAPESMGELLLSGDDFIAMSNQGFEAKVMTPATDLTVAPSVVEASFDVAENTATGTVIGQLEIMRNAPLAAPVSEFIQTSSNSSAVAVNANGEVVVADASLLDYDSGLTTVSLEVMAADSVGNISEPATVTVNVTNLLDEDFEQPTPPEPEDSGSSGSLGWFALMLLSGLRLFRKRS